MSIGVLFILVVSTIPLLNKYKYTINSVEINAFSSRFKGHKVYLGSIPFLMRFSGYSVDVPTEYDKDKFYTIELECALNKKDTKLLVSLIKISSRYSSGEPKTLSVVGKHVISGKYVIQYLQGGIPESVFRELDKLDK